MAIAGRVMPRPMGEYDPSILYDILDMVSYDNKLWICKQICTVGVEPNMDNTEHWQLSISDAISNALTLNGRSADYFATAELVNSILNGTVAVGDANKLGGQASDYYAAAEAVTEIINGEVVVDKASTLTNAVTNTTQYRAAIQSDGTMVIRKTTDGGKTWTTYNVLSTSNSSAVKTFTNVVVNYMLWTSDSTYADYPYKAEITISGATKNDVPLVTFALTDVESFAPVCATGNGIVIVYASGKPTVNITIPSICLIKGGS